MCSGEGICDERDNVSSYSGCHQLGRPWDHDKRRSRSISTTRRYTVAVQETGTRHGEIQCLERVFTQTKLSNLTSYVHATGSEFKAR